MKKIILNGLTVFGGSINSYKSIISRVNSVMVFIGIFGLFASEFLATEIHMLGIEWIGGAPVRTIFIGLVLWGFSVVVVSLGMVPFEERLGISDEKENEVAKLKEIGILLLQFVFFLGVFAIFPMQGATFVASVAVVCAVVSLYISTAVIVNILKDYVPSFEFVVLRLVLIGCVLVTSWNIIL